MRVKQRAQRLGVINDTVRYYTRIGLLEPARMPDNGYKEYGEREFKRLRFILSARALGFTVDDITEILRVADKGDSPCRTVRRLIEIRLHEVEARFVDTVALRTRMQAAIKEWETLPDRSPTADSICHLIENFVPDGETEPDVLEEAE